MNQLSAPPKAKVYENNFQFARKTPNNKPSKTPIHQVLWWHGHEVPKFQSMYIAHSKVLL